MTSKQIVEMDRTKYNPVPELYKEAIKEAREIHMKQD